MTDKQLHDEIERLLSIAEKDHLKQVNAIRLIIKDGVEVNQQQSPSTPDNHHTTHNTTSKKQPDKTLDQLLSELKSDNKDNLDVLKLLDDKTLTTQLDQIDQCYHAKSTLIETDKPISAWDQNDCIRRAKELKMQPGRANDSAFLTEIIAVLVRAVELSCGFKPRLTQLMSLLLLLEGKGRGRLAKIVTGEGKSTPIVAMLAAVKALQGEKVDIVSSSPVLALRDSKENAAFFKLVDLSVSCNWDPDKADNLCQGYKECYSAEIVYGDANQFRFDLLDHEYKHQNTRGDRPYQAVIADEADSLFIDESMNLASLGSYKPMMSELNILFASAWLHLKQAKDLLEAKKIELPIDEKTGKPVDKKDFLVAVVKARLLLILNSDELPSHVIPNHLKEFAIQQAPHWARSAVRASEEMILNKDYVITTVSNKRIIAPVDYNNTGVTHNNSEWEDEQQFLQLKHKLPLSAQNLTASFISNIAYFKRYQKLIGVTGTPGSADDQALLKQAYDIDIASIPTHKVKDFTELPGYPAETEETWLEAIVVSVKKQVAANNAVLLICESINAAHQNRRCIKGSWR